jgi:hypothetical protein
MPGASEQTRLVKILNANWTPETDKFEVMMVTEDDRRHSAPASAASISAVVALAAAGTVLAWDPENQTLIFANIVGEMPWTVGMASP